MVFSQTHQIGAGYKYSEADPEFAGNLALQDVAEDVVLNGRVGQVGNLQHGYVLSAAPAYATAGVDNL